MAAERRLFGLVRDRPEQEFERIYRKHAEDVFRYSLLVLRSRPDAEDVTQATFTRAYRAMQRGEKVRKPQHWLIKIAHNECRRHLRTASRRALEVELDPAIAEAPEPDDGPTAEEIRVALSHLSFNQRAALVMRELEDRSYAEIAEVLGLSVSAVETLLFRARRALREQMEGPLACGEVEALLSKQMDGELSGDDKRRLRAHTRSCAECATLERQHRGRRAALRRLGSIITLPPSLSSFVGGGSSAVATGALVGLGAKAAAVVVAALAVTGVGVAEAVKPHHRSNVREGRPLPVELPAARVPAPAPAARVSSSAPAIASDAVLRSAPTAAPTKKRAAVGGPATAANAHNTPGFERPTTAKTAPPAAGEPAAASPAAAAPKPAPASAEPTTTVRETVTQTVQTVTTALPAVPAVTVPQTPPVTPTLPPPPPVPTVTVPTVTVPTVTVPTTPSVTLPLPLPPPPPPPPPPKLP